MISLDHLTKHKSMLCHVGNLAATQEVTSKEDQTNENSSTASATKMLQIKVIVFFFFCGKNSSTASATKMLQIKVIVSGGNKKQKL